MKRERLQTLNKIDKLLNVCKSCDKRDTSHINYLHDCVGCKVYEQLNICGSKLEGKPIKQRKPVQSRSGYTKEEDAIIIAEFKNGKYYGINKKLAGLLGRMEGSVAKRTKILIKKGLIKE